MILKFFCVAEEVMLGSCPDYIYFLTHGGQGGIGCNSKFYLMCFLLSQNNNILLNLRVYL
jgi:hypothetical protein